MANSNDDGVPPLNQQIVDAVETSTEYAFGLPGKGSAGGLPKYNAGEAIAYEKVAQAAAYQVQDATDYQRNILSVNSAAQGKALALMFKDAETGDMQKLEIHAIIFVLSIVGSFAAGLTAEFIGTNAGKVLSSFPPN